jgi:hypothetical protein
LDACFLQPFSGAILASVDRDPDDGMPGPMADIDRMPMQVIFKTMVLPLIRSANSPGLH